MATPQKKTNALQDLLLGGTSGIIAKTVCAPLERTKILLQTQSVNTQLTEAQRYKGIIDAMTRIPKEQGFSAFWRGNFTNCVRYFPIQAMNFAFKERYQRLFVKPRSEVGFPLHFLGYLAAGGAAGATSLTVSYPLDYAFTRLAADVGHGNDRQFNGLRDCVQKTLKSDGIRGLYRGFAPSVGGIIIYRAGYFGLYDSYKNFLAPAGHGPAQLFTNFCAALGIDILSAMCAYPLDTIRRRLMMQSGRQAKDVLYTTTLQCGRAIMATEGLKGMYKGAYMNSIRAIASALVLVIYDELKYITTGVETKKAH